MINQRVALIFCLASAPITAQQAVLEVSGLFGECKPVYAAAFDNLKLFKSPDLESEQIDLNYKQGWRIPYEKSNGITRVISFGVVRFVREEPLLYCTVPPINGNVEMMNGDTATYLYYLGEGYAKVRARGTECQVDIGFAEILEYPEVQPWIRFLFLDGSSPGWLLNNGVQTIGAGVEC